MTYEAWSPLFLGMVLAMLLANSVQWLMYRERIYSLYSAYTFTWAIYFTINHAALPLNIANFYKLILSYGGYILYLELAKIFLNLRERPAFLRWVVRVQWLLVVYCVVKTYVYLFTDFWQTQWHTILLQPVRFALLGVGSYIVYSFYRSKDVVARFFVAGTTALLLNHAITIVLLLHSPAISQQMPFWQHPDLFVQTGVVLDLICFSLGISYRHRQQAVLKVVFEKNLEHEREQRHREHLEADLAMQRLEQEKTQIQLKALQGQINPHFLFNGLNTLSSLIDESPRQAGDFVDELSKVYRYLLRSNDGELTPLSAELDFVHSYFHLLKTRHSDGIYLDVAVDQPYTTALIPPLSLQLLIENAVKHNVISAKYPLTIRLRINEQHQLVVENTLRRRVLRVDSNGVGLANIISKYRLLNQPIPLVEQQDGWFRVTLPLILVSPKSASDLVTSY